MEKGSQSKDYRDRDEKPSSKQISSHDGGRKKIRWLTYARSRVVFGLDHLSSVDMPTMHATARGIALSFESISNWQPPRALGADDYDVAVQLSISTFHLKSKSFFGSTWMGSQIMVRPDGLIPENFDYSDIVYLLTRITDPSCVIIIEIVASKLDKRGIVLSQYG